MRTEDILSNPPKVLSQQQREFYFEHGYLSVASLVPMDWIERLRAVTDALVEQGGRLTKPDAVFDLEPGHTPESPRLRRISNPVAEHALYWEFASQSIIADVVADLVGPNVKFHHSKLNFKWARGGEEVKWHQDIQFYPHTNYTPLAIGTYLNDCGPEQAPLGVIPGSHEGPLYDQYDGNGKWAGCLSEGDLAKIDLDRAVYLPGPAGSVTIHNCRAVHGSAPNLSEHTRPLLINAYTAADAFPYTFNPMRSPYIGAIVRGEPAKYAHHDPRPCLIPPDWSGGYSSIFAAQQEEDSQPPAPKSPPDDIATRQ